MPTSANKASRLKLGKVAIASFEDTKYCLKLLKSPDTDAN
jgi:hypothetical protein